MGETVVRRSCAICEATCALRFRVDPGERRVLAIEGNEDDPISRGHLCPKAFAMKEVFEDPDRLRRPLRRTRGGWQEVGWDEAIDEAATRLAELRERHGPDANAIYVGNPMGFDVGAMLYNRAFGEALATPRAFSAATMDHFPKLVASRVLYGKGAILSIPDIDRTDYFLCLGGNPLVSQGSLMAAPGVRSRIRAIRARGGRVVVVDPRRSETAAEADEHLFIRPGADAYLLFAIVNVLFAEGLVRLGRLEAFTDGVDRVEALARDFPPEAVAARTSIDANTIRRLARELAGRERAICYGRIGTSTVAYGLLASWLVEVVNLLTGHLDEPGGMMFPRPATGQLEPGAEAPPFSVGRWRSAVRGLPEVDGQLPVAAMAEEMEAEHAGTRRIRGFVTLAGNPVLSTPNGARLARALGELDFMLSLDIYRNETTRHAHLILPNASLLEEENYDFLTQTSCVRNFARHSSRVFDPEPGTLAQWEILLRLAAKLSGTTPEALDARMFDRVVARMIGRRADLDEDTARAKLGDAPGPLRQVDAMLRAGPFGDAFDDGAPGLSLAKLRAAGIAADLGALEPRLPDLLRSPGRRIDLAHPFLVADVPRLARGLSETPDGLVLVGRRQARNMNSWLHNLPALAAGRPRCTLLVHPDDAARLGLAEGRDARVSSRVGAVVAPVEISDEMMPGVVSLPHGFGHTEPDTALHVASARQPGASLNALSDEALLDPHTGTSVVNGFPVEVAPAP